MLGSRRTLLLIILFVFNFIEASSLEIAAGFIKQVFLLDSVSNDFEKRYPKAPKIACVSCKTEITYGSIIGSVIGKGFMATLKGEYAADIKNISDELFEALSTKSLEEINICMLSALKKLQIKCYGCHATEWDVLKVKQP